MWIAFIFISLTYNVLNSLNKFCCELLSFSYLWHNRRHNNKRIFCCELLSFSYLWHIRNSPSTFLNTLPSVVNCFHFHIFDISETVLNQFKEVYNSCELLSFSYLWHIRNSGVGHAVTRLSVVNCFHFHIFDISETVYSRKLLRW